MVGAADGVRTARNRRPVYIPPRSTLSGAPAPPMRSGEQTIELIYMYNTYYALCSLFMAIFIYKRYYYIREIRVYVNAWSFSATATLVPIVAIMPITCLLRRRLAALTQSPCGIFIPLRLSRTRVVQNEQFEWDDNKAAENLRSHRVSFEQATYAFNDAFAVEWIADRKAYDEERCNLLGMHEGVVLHVTYTEGSARHRIISARRATRHEQDDYYRQNAP